MHICVSKLTIIGSDNGLSPDRHQAMIWTDDGILLIGPLGTSFSEILIEIHAFFIQENAFENVVWKMAAILFQPQCVNHGNLFMAVINFHASYVVTKWQMSFWGQEARGTTYRP